MKSDKKYVLFTDESLLDGSDGWVKGWHINGDQAPARRSQQELKVSSTSLLVMYAFHKE